MIQLPIRNVCSFTPVNFFKKAFLFALTALALSGWSAKAMPNNNVFKTPPPIYFRPGGTSYTWKIGTGYTALSGYPGYYPVTQVEFINSSPALSRGHFEYSLNSGSSWTTYAMGNLLNNGANLLWRFVDTSPADTNSQYIFCGWVLQGPPGTTTTGESVIPDAPPTDITPDLSVPVILSTATVGSKIDKFTPVDTGWTLNGAWAIDSQSVPGLFNLNWDATQGNTATLTLNSSSLSIGQTASVTVHYYDCYQTDTNGVPIPGQGIARTYTYTMISEATTNLNFTPNIPVNTYTNDDQNYPYAVTLSDGTFATVWQSAGEYRDNNQDHSIIARRFTSAGVPIGNEFRISSANLTSDDLLPVATALDNGRFAVAYRTWNGSAYDIGLSMVDSTTNVTMATANFDTDGNHYYPAIATLTNGNIVVMWSSDNGDVRNQQFTSDGTPDGFERQSSPSGYAVGVTALNNGDYAYAYADGNTYEVMVAVGSANTPVSTGIMWSGYGAPRLNALANGFVLASESYELSGLSEIAVQRFDNTGAKQGSVFHANSGANGNRYYASTATLTDGSFVVAWYSDTDDFSYDGIFGRRFQADGTPIDSADFEINEHRLNDQSYPSVAPLAGATFAAVWTDSQAPAFIGDIQTRVLLPQAAPAPVITGTLTATGVYGTLFGGYTIGASNSPTGFSASGLPAGLLVDTTTGMISGTPTAPGIFNVTITATNATGSGSATLVITIAQATASITLTGDGPTYDGTAKSMSATTTPSGLSFEITYNGSLNAPTNAGSYTAIGTIDNTNYVGAVTNSFTIHQAPLTVAADDKTRSFRDPNPVFTGNISGALPGDHLTASFTTAATQYSPSGSYPIVASVNDPDGKLADYSVSATNGNLVITPVPFTLTVTNGSPTQFHFTAVAEPNHTYVLQTSTNLYDWSFLTNLPVNNGLIEFLDDNIQSNGNRFFRIGVQ